jgi:hypothetical protein
MEDVETAARLLDEAMAGIGYKSRVEYMLHDKDLDPVRQHPRYIAMVERLRDGKSAA